MSFQGRPLSGGLVAFSPDPDRGGSGKPMCAEIASDGLFQLTVSGDLLIPAGWYRVTIAPNPSTALSTSQDRAAFPPQLARPDRSGLVRQVLPGRENYFEFCVQASVGE